MHYATGKIHKVIGIFEMFFMPSLKVYLKKYAGSDEEATRDRAESELSQEQDQVRVRPLRKLDRRVALPRALSSETAHPQS
jgi:hypothetical protein